MAKSLYICYFGINEPLVQTQVLPYLREIMKGGVEVSLLTFEPAVEGKNQEFESIRVELESEGIKWNWLKYHKRPSALATAYDIFLGAVFVRNAILRERPDILHGRVHVPTLMGALGRKLANRRPKLLFDIRGFFPEEYTDAGVWPENGWLYRSAKRVERWLMKEADGFVVLTEKARELLFPEAVQNVNTSGLVLENNGRPVAVIPCCVDMGSRFSGNGMSARDKVRGQLGLEGRFVITHVGSLHGLYLTDEIADFLAAAREKDPRTFALFLTQSDPNTIVPLLKERGFAETDYFVGKVPSAAVPDYLEVSDLGLSFVRAGYATLSRSPTKIPEYLVCGLPVVANEGVGDVDKLITSNSVGTLVRDFKTESYKKALEAIENLGDIEDRCRETAVREFDLATVGGQRYRAMYKRLLESGK